VILAPHEAETGQAVTLDSSDSYDVEDPNAALQARWDVNGDGNYSAWASLGSMQHTYNTAGTYSVGLQVRDSEGLITTTTTTITVTDPITQSGPVAHLTLSQTNIEYGTYITVDASGSYDPDGGPLWYRFDIGDGNWTGWLDARYSVVGGRMWLLGSYTFRVQVKNDSGEVAEAAVNYTVYA
jgi:hypothetical protein